MKTSVDPNTSPSKSRWPTGLTFVMYCAGASLLMLAVSVAISGKPFIFSVDPEKSSVSLHAGLLPQGVSEEKAQEKSSEFQQQFIAAKSTFSETTESAPSGMALFNGTWEGGGSTYELIQDGTTIFLSETTDGITTAYGTGEANGPRAQLNVQTGIGTIAFELIAESETRIKITGPGIPENFYIRKL